MTLSHAILGLLSRSPSTGYDLTRMFDASLRTTWHASHSQIYPELARLEGAGLVEVVGRGPRRSKTYDLTTAGRDELRQWLVESEPDRSVRNESGVRLFLTPLLGADDMRAIYARDLAFVEQELTMLDQLRAEMHTSERPEVFTPQVDLGLRINSAIRDWLRDQLRNLPSTDPLPTT